MRHEWTDPELGRYAIEDGRLFTTVGRDPELVATDPDGLDGVALLREAERLAAENFRMAVGQNDIAAERARIRGELLAYFAAASKRAKQDPVYATKVTALSAIDGARLALDRICPEEPRECAAFIAGDPSTCPRNNCDDCPEEG